MGEEARLVGHAHAARSAHANAHVIALILFAVLAVSLLLLLMLVLRSEILNVADPPETTTAASCLIPNTTCCSSMTATALKTFLATSSRTQDLHFVQYIYRIIKGVTQGHTRKHNN